MARGLMSWTFHVGQLSISKHPIWFMIPFGPIHGIQWNVVCCFYPVELCIKINIVTARKKHTFGPHSSVNSYVNGEILVFIPVMTILKWASHIACRRLLEMCFCFHHFLKVMLKNPIIMGYLCRDNIYCRTGFIVFLYLTTEVASLPKRHLYQVCP